MEPLLDLVNEDKLTHALVLTPPSILPSMSALVFAEGIYCVMVEAGFEEGSARVG